MIIENGIWRVCQNEKCRHTQLVRESVDDYVCEVCGHNNVFKMPSAKIPLIILGIGALLYLIISLC